MEEPQLSPAHAAALQQAIAEFNAGQYFVCHETLEDVWVVLRGPARDFLQGLIQVAAAFVQLDRGKVRGFDTLLSRALTRLAPYPDHYLGFDLATLRQALAVGRARVEDGAEWANRPRWPGPQPV